MIGPPVRALAMPRAVPVGITTADTKSGQPTSDASSGMAAFSVAVDPDTAPAAAVHTAPESGTATSIPFNVTCVRPSFVPHTTKTWEPVAAPEVVTVTGTELPTEGVWLPRLAVTSNEAAK